MLTWLQSIRKAIPRRATSAVSPVSSIIPGPRPIPTEEEVPAVAGELMRAYGSVARSLQAMTNLNHHHVQPVIKLQAHHGRTGCQTVLRHGPAFITARLYKLAQSSSTLIGLASPDSGGTRAPDLQMSPPSGPEMSIATASPHRRPAAYLD